MPAVGIVAIVLLALALAVVVGAEWPRIARARPARPAPAKRARKQRLTVVQGGPVEDDDADDFARSVERDLASLPVVEPHDR